MASTAPHVSTAFGKKVIHNNRHQLPLEALTLNSYPHVLPFNDLLVRSGPLHYLVR